MHCHWSKPVPAHGPTAAQLDAPASVLGETQHCGVAPEQYWTPASVASLKLYGQYTPPSATGTWSVGGFAQAPLLLPLLLPPLLLPLLLPPLLLPPLLLPLLLTPLLLPLLLPPLLLPLLPPPASWPPLSVAGGVLELQAATVLPASVRSAAPPTKAILWIFIFYSAPFVLCRRAAHISADAPSIDSARFGHNQGGESICS